MAIYECDFGRHRYPQAQQTIYFTQVLGNSIDTYRCRMCPTHFRENAVSIQEHMALIDDNSQISQSCERCGKARDGALYAKVFPAKAEMQQYALDLCAPCLGALGNQLRIFNGSHLTGSPEHI